MDAGQRPRLSRAHLRLAGRRSRAPRSAGKSVGRVRARGDLRRRWASGFEIGFGPAEEKRAADMTPLEPPPELREAARARRRRAEPPLVLLAFMNPSGERRPQLARAPPRRDPGDQRPRHGAWRSRGSTARSRAAASSTACGCSRAESVERARSLQAEGTDALLEMPDADGARLLAARSRRCASFAMGPNEGAFGHPGAGGGLGFADPARARRLRLRHEPDGLERGDRRAPERAARGLLWRSPEWFVELARLLRLDLLLDFAQAVLPEEQLVADVEARGPEGPARDRTLRVRDQLLLRIGIRRAARSSSAGRPDSRVPPRSPGCRSSWAPPTCADRPRRRTAGNTRGAAPRPRRA